jgi:hypothetical protein
MEFQGRLYEPVHWKRICTEEKTTILSTRWHNSNRRDFSRYFYFSDNEKFLLYTRSSRYANVLDILDGEKNPPTRTGEAPTAMRSSRIFFISKKMR